MIRRGKHERVEKETTEKSFDFTGMVSLLILLLLAVFSFVIIIFANTPSERKLEVRTYSHEGHNMYLKIEKSSNTENIESTTTIATTTTEHPETTIHTDTTTTTQSPESTNPDTTTTTHPVTTTTTYPTTSTTYPTTTTTVQPTTTTTYPITTTTTVQPTTTTTYPVTTTTHPATTTTTTPPSSQLMPNIGMRQPIIPDLAYPGSIIEYRLILTNFGRGEAINVTASEELPEGLTYVDTGSRFRKWSFGSISPNGGEVEVIYLVKASDGAQAGGYDNRVTIRADNHSEYTVTNSLNIVQP